VFAQLLLDSSGCNHVAKFGFHREPALLFNPCVLKHNLFSLHRARYIRACRCGQCERPFSLVVRRHHCRHCGEELCGWCCDQYTDIAWMEFFTNVRVCRACYHSVMQEKRKDALFHTLRPLIARGTLSKMRMLPVFLMPGEVVDVADEQGVTPLMEAAAQGVPEVFLPLLHDCGANIDAVDREGRTVLMHAALGGVRLIIKQLLDAGAEIQAKDHAGYTALTHAKMRGNEDAVDMLLSAALKTGLLGTPDRARALAPSPAAAGNPTRDASSPRADHVTNSDSTGHRGSGAGPADSDSDSTSNDASNAHSGDPDRYREEERKVNSDDDDYDERKQRDDGNMSPSRDVEQLDELVHPSPRKDSHAT